MLKNKQGKNSKTKWGALLIGIGTLFGTIGGLVNGQIDISSGINAIIVEVGGIFLAIGIRDIPFLN